MYTPKISKKMYTIGDEDWILFFQNDCGEDDKKKEEEESKGVSGGKSSAKELQKETSSGDDKNETETSSKKPENTSEDVGDMIKSYSIDQQKHHICLKGHIHFRSHSKTTILSKCTKITNCTNNNNEKPTTSTISEKDRNESSKPSFLLFYTTPVASKPFMPVQLESIKVTAEFVTMNGKDGRFFCEITLQKCYTYYNQSNSTIPS